MAGDRGGIGCGGRGAGVVASRDACTRRRGRVAGASRHLSRAAGAFRHSGRAARRGLPRANHFVSADFRASRAGSYLDLGAGVDVGDVGGDAGGARDIVQGEFGHEGVLRRGKREEGQLRVRQIGADCPSVP